MNLAREVKELWNLRMTVIQILLGALGALLKFPDIGIGNQRKNRNSPNSTLLRLARIFC